MHEGVNQTWSSAVVPACLPYQLRQFQTSCPTRDIDQAAKYIGAGAATVGVAGSGQKISTLHCFTACFSMHISTLQLWVGHLHARYKGVWDVL